LVNKPFRHLSFLSYAHAQWVGSQIPPIFAMNIFVNTKLSIVGLWSCIGIYMTIGLPLLCQLIVVL